MKAFLSLLGCRAAKSVVSAIAILVIFQGPYLAAQQEKPAGPDVEENDTASLALESLKAEDTENRKASATFKTSVFALDAETNALILERIRRYQKHQIAALEHREQVFNWQLISNKVSFVVVLVLVLSGICFSAVQFWKSMQMPADKFAEAADTEFSAGADGVTVRSSVLGVVVLVISLAFFYLYLVHVFPIEELTPIRDSEVEATVPES